MWLILFSSIGLTMNAQNAELASTPPMGWMSWYPFIDQINEELIIEVADSLISTGLREVGYNIVQLDDGWMAKTRNKQGRQYADTIRFPHGIKYLADYMHAHGLKLGIYSSAGSKTCAGYPGSYGHEEIDANTYAEWGIDYLKYDACGDTGGQTVKELNYKMSKALKLTGRSILYEICIFKSGETHLWGGVIANMWRTGEDIVTYISKNPEVTYKNWYNNLNQVVGKETYAGKGHWNDPDNLIVGFARNNKQTFEEQKAQFSFWSLIAAPLILGNDVRNMTTEIKEILLNKEVIEINQDKAGIQGIRMISNDSYELWMKGLFDGSKAIVLFNKKESRSDITLNLNDIKLSGKFLVRDLWEHKDKGIITDSYIVKVEPHGIVMLKLLNQ